MPTFSNPVRVRIRVDAPPDADIYYTENGGDPTQASTPYDDNNRPLVSESTVIRARGYKDGYAASAVGTDTIIIGGPCYGGYSPLTILTEAQLLAMSNAPLDAANSRQTSHGDWVFGANSTVSDYFFFWWPDGFSNPSAINGFWNPDAGLPIAMATDAEGYTSIVNGWNYWPLTVNSVLGKLFRTYNQVGGGGQKTRLVQ